MPSIGKSLHVKLSALTAVWNDLMLDLKVKDDVDTTITSDKHGLQQLEKWLKDTDDILTSTKSIKAENALKMLEILTQLDIEAGQMEDLHKAISKKSTQHPQVCTRSYSSKSSIHITFRHYIVF